MRITTKKQVNILGWAIVIVICACALVHFLTNAEITSAIVGLVFIGSLCLFEVVCRSGPGQKVFSYSPMKSLPENRFLRWTVLLAGGIVLVDWVLEIGEFLIAG